MTRRPTYEPPEQSLLERGRHAAEQLCEELQAATPDVGDWRVVTCIQDCNALQRPRCRHRFTVDSGEYELSVECWGDDHDDLRGSFEFDFAEAVRQVNEWHKLYKEKNA